jgi:pyruvate formate lyase activating enzyme
MCQWIATELDPDVPLHFSAFHPDFKLTDRPPTPLPTLHAAYQAARDAGLRYVYTGNVQDPAHGHTYCPNCGRAVICRQSYAVTAFELHGGACTNCQTPIAGRYDDAAGTWGSRRMPVKIADCKSEI